MKLSKLEKQKSVIDRLEKQLKSGIKPRKTGRQFSSYNKEELVWNEEGKPVAIKLNQADITRINKEIEVLKTRI